MEDKKADLNTKCSEELRQFLDYISGKEAAGTLTQGIDSEVKKARQKAEWRSDYMTLTMRDQEKRQEGFREGVSQGISQGISQKAKEVFDKMIADGFQLSKAMELSGYNPDAQKQA